MSDLLRQLASGRPPSIERPPSTGVVVRSDRSGVWVARIDDDTRDPIGPCRGGRRYGAGGVLERLPVGTPVLLVWTDERPWIAAHDLLDPSD
ncbi:hypothetical protein ACOACO_17410 [Nocardioides sp. CPCC 205120]|uniref:hypothetical protein n=1 Tax=Nocardioides sp. CPCC 205120 TaxID=3406462 RepID=UPI003B513875